METVVKIEVEDFTYLREATVDDVYVDIDGAVEEAEKYMHTDAEDVKPVVTDMKIKRERISPLPWQCSENTSFTDVQKRFSFAGQDVKFDPLTKKSSARSNQSDEEIDVDTPYLEKLRGQTGSKAETTTSCHPSSLGLGLLNSGLSGLLGSKVIRRRKTNHLFRDKDEISVTSRFSQKESNCPPKSVAKKSATTRVTSKKTSIVSKKSTSKQSKPARKSNYNAIANVQIKLAAKQSECSEREPNNNTVPFSDFSSRLPSKHAVSDLGERDKHSSLNVARKSTSKQAQSSVTVSSLPSQTLNCSEMVRQSPLMTHELASSQNAEHHNVELGMSSGLYKGPDPTPSLCSNEVSSSEKLQSAVTHPSPSQSQDLLLQPKTTFAFIEKSSKIIACPECGVETVQWRLKDHLKTVHDLQLNTCTKCKIGFTDVNQYSEHYAFHLQQEENHIAKILRSPINAGFTRQRLTREQRKQWMTKRKLSAMGVQQSSEASNHNFSDTSSEAVTSVRLGDSVQAVPKSPSQHIPSPVKRSQRLKFKTRRSYPFSSSYYQNFVPSNYPKVTANTKIHQKGFASSRTEWGSTSSLNIFERTKSSVKTTQGAQVRTCAKCKKDFTDLNQYSEHVAFHLQQEETWKAGIKRSPSKNGFVNQQVSLVADYAKSDEASQFTALCRNGQFSAQNPKVFSMSRPCGPQSFDQSVSCSSPQSQVSSCFDEMEKDNTSAALLKEVETEFQRGWRSRTSSSSLDMCSPPSKRQRLEECVDDRETCTVSGNSCSKATVSIVSLEAAAQPFNCKMCLQAFHTALACPESFRQHFQDKLSADNLEEGSAAQFSPSSWYQDAPSSLYSDEDADEETETRENKDAETVGVASSNVCLQQEVTHGNRVYSPKKGGSRKSGGYECNVCHDIFQDHSDLLKHAPYHLYQFACGFCCKAYQEKVDLFDHFEIAHGGRMQFWCKYCERRFEDLIHFHTHIKTHKDGTIVRCTECNKKFSSSQQMLLHVKNCHGPCEVCGEQFLEEKLFLEHLRTAHRKQSTHLQPVVSKRLSCRVCARVFQTLTGLLSHKRSQHRISSSSRTEVTHSRVSTASSKKGKTSPSMSREKRLPLLLESNVNFTHSVTGASGINDADKHADKQTSVAQKCRKCGKKFGCNLGKAFLAHTKFCHAKEGNSRGTSEKAASIPKKCVLCQKTFAWRKSLVRHMVVCHQLTREELSFNMTCMRNRKLEVKAEKCPLHLCKICKECFTVEKSFKLHLANKHKGKSGFFQCRFCKKYFTRNFTLVLHLQRRHQGRPPFLCRGCLQEFNTSEAVLVHSCCTDSLKDCREKNAESDHETPQICVKKEDPEYRYKCGACNIGFYIAHEWTKHMQEHFDNGEDSDNSEMGQTIPECEEQVNSCNTDRSCSFSCQNSDVDECIEPDTCDHSEKQKSSPSLSSEREEETTSQGDSELLRTAGSALGASQSLDNVKTQGQIIHDHFTCQNTDKTLLEEKLDIVQENGGTSSVEGESAQESVAHAQNPDMELKSDEGNKLCYNSQMNSQGESSLGAFEDWYVNSLISEYLADTDTSFTHAGRSVQEKEITTENTSDSRLESTSPAVCPQSSEDRHKEVTEDHDALDDKIVCVEHGSSGEKHLLHVETTVQNWSTSDDNHPQQPTLMQEKPISDEQPVEVCKSPVLINETHIVDRKISGEQGKADGKKTADRNPVEETTAVLELLNEAQKDLHCSTSGKAGSKILQSLKIKSVFMCQICKKIFEDGSSITGHKCDTFDSKNSTVSQENLSFDFLQTSSEKSVKLSEITYGLNSRNSESNESLGENCKRLEDEPIGESKRLENEHIDKSSKKPEDEQSGDCRRPEDELLDESSKKPEDEQLGDSKRPEDEQLGDSNKPEDELLDESTKKSEQWDESGKRHNKQLDNCEKRQGESDAQSSCKETTRDEDSDVASCEYPNTENPSKESIQEDALTAAARGSSDMQQNHILNRSDEMEQDQSVEKEVWNSRKGGADLEKQIGELDGTTLDSQEIKQDCKAEDFKDHKYLMSHSMEKCVAVLKSKLGSRCRTKQLGKGEQAAQNSEGASTCPVQNTQEMYTADVESVKHISKGMVDEGRKIGTKQELRRPNIFDVISSKNAFSCDVAGKKMSKDEDLFSQNHESVQKEPNDIHMLSTCKESFAKEVIDHSCEEACGAETVGKTRQIYIPIQNSWDQSCETSGKTCGNTSTSPKLHDPHYPDVFDEETDDSNDQSPVGKDCDRCADDGDSPVIRPNEDEENGTSADLNLILLTESKGEEREGDDKVCFDTDTAAYSHDPGGQLQSADCMDVTVAREDETRPEKCVQKYTEELQAELSMNETLGEEEGVHVLSSVISEDRDEKETCEEKPVQTVQGNLATAELCMGKGSTDSATTAGAKPDQRPNIFDMLSLDNFLVCKEPYTAQHLHSECYRVPLEENKSLSACGVEQERTSKEKSPEEISVVSDSNDSLVKVLDAVEGKNDGECDETGTTRRRSNDLSDYLPVGLYIRQQCKEPEDQKHSEDMNSTQNSSVEPDLFHPQNDVSDKLPLCAMEKQKGNYILNNTGDSPKGNEESTVMECAEGMNGSEMNDVAERISAEQRTHFNSDEGISRKGETVKSGSLARPVTLETEQNPGTPRNPVQNEPWNNLNKKEPISAVVVDRKTQCIPVLQNVQKLMSRIRRKSSLRQGKKLGKNKKEPQHIDKNAGRDTLETQDRKVESTLVNENQAETCKFTHRRFGDGDSCEKQDHRSNIFDILSEKTASTSQAVLKEPADKNSLGIHDSCSLLSDQNLSHSPFHILNGTSKLAEVNKEPTDSVRQTLTSDYGIFSVLSGTLTEGSKNLEDNDSSSIPHEVLSAQDNQAESELRKQLTQLLLNSQLNSQQGLGSEYLSDSSVNSSSSRGDRPDEPCVAHIPVKSHKASEVDKTAQMKGPFEILQDYMMMGASVSQPKENLGLLEAQHNVERSKPVHEVKSLEEKDNSTCRCDDQLGKVNQKQTRSARQYLENLRKKVTLDNVPYRRKEARRIHTAKGSKRQCVSVSQDENLTDNRHEIQTDPVHSRKSISSDSGSRGAGVMSLSATDRRQNIFDVLLENSFT